MPILIILTVLVQAFFIFHVMRTGRPYWWAFIILSAPVIGSLIYYFVEVFPNSQEHRNVRKKVREISRSLQPDAELRRRTDELEICGSMDNKLALARECEAVGMYDDAVRLYKSCLTGAYANDPQLTLLLAQAELMLDDSSKSAELLDRLQAGHPNFKPHEIMLLRARILEKNGNTADALALYENLVPVYSGLEAKCRHASLLKSLGRIQEAEAIFTGVLQHAKRFNISHEAELDWVRFAKNELRG